MTSKDELKPCPFCGAKVGVVEKYAEKDKYGDAVISWRIVCPECNGMMTDSFEDRIADKWNSRRGQP